MLEMEATVYAVDLMRVVRESKTSLASYKDQEHRESIDEKRKIKKKSLP